MTLAAISVSTLPLDQLDADVLVLGVSRSDDGPRILGDAGLDLGFGDLAAIGVTGAKDELVRLPSVSAVSARSIALVGLGSDAPKAQELRYAAGVAGRRLTGVESVALALPVSGPEDAQAILEGALLGAYDYIAYRSDASMPPKLPASSFVLATSTPVPDASLATAREVGRAVHLVRDLVNMPPLDLYPASFADRAIELASEAGVEVEVWDEAALERDGFGGILGVGQGSSRPPRLVKVAYSPAGASRHLALVGKGITFDSGGLSLKPPVSMVGMKYDMTGAATALSVVLAAARLGLPVAVTGWLCLAENLPSATAIRPNDVLRIRGGRTVEVLNTDAEGRLVLADGIVAASEEYPDAIIDIATLTGAAMVAMGNRYVATMGNDDEFTAKVVAAAKSVDEPFWPMPFPEELRALINSDVADLANVKPGNTAGGMLIAGVFLNEFVGETEDGSRRIPWAHLDIAGAAQNRDSGYGFTPKGPTGVTVRTLLALARDDERPGE